LFGAPDRHLLVVCPRLLRVLFAFLPSPFFLVLPLPPPLRLIFFRLSEPAVIFFQCWHSPVSERFVARLTSFPLGGIPPETSCGRAGYGRKLLGAAVESSNPRTPGDRALCFASPRSRL